MSALPHGHAREGEELKDIEIIPAQPHGQATSNGGLLGM